MDWKGVGIVGVWAAVAVGLSMWLGTFFGNPAVPTPSEEVRVVSLSPAITETLFALGVGELVVARTDHCLQPAAATSVASIGPGLSPDLEGIAKRQPTLILTDAGAVMNVRSLSKIAPTEALKWLTLDDVTKSIRTLGRWVGREQEASVLSQRLHDTLSVSAPADALRVLLLIGVEPKADSLWYIRPNSLHGRALEAAGGRNAMDATDGGAPELSLEALLKINPDVIIGLSDGPASSPAKREAFIRRFDTFPGLKAAQEKRIFVIARPGTMSVGPTILELAKELRAVISSSGEAAR